ncbi:hypothetical protein EON62_05750, partial [archaeon]
MLLFPLAAVGTSASMTHVRMSAGVSPVAAAASGGTMWDAPRGLTRATSPVAVGAALQGAFTSAVSVPPSFGDAQRLCMQAASTMLAAILSVLPRTAQLVNNLSFYSAQSTSATAISVGDGARSADSVSDIPWSSFSERTLTLGPPHTVTASEPSAFTAAVTSGSDALAHAHHARLPSVASFMSQRTGTPFAELVAAPADLELRDVTSDGAGTVALTTRLSSGGESTPSAVADVGLAGGEDTTGVATVVRDGVPPADGQLPALHHGTTEQIVSRPMPHEPQPTTSMPSARSELSGAGVTGARVGAGRDTGTFSAATTELDTTLSTAPRAVLTDAPTAPLRPTAPAPTDAGPRRRRTLLVPRKGDATVRVDDAAPRSLPLSF